MAAVQQPGPQPPRSHPQKAALPLYDLFLDLPHPAATRSSPQPFILGAPSTGPDLESELHSNLSRIGRFAFPEFDDATAQAIPRDSELNRFSQYAMQPKTFQHYTFSLQLQSGVRVHGHVRRYLPMHPVVKSRYDVGRRGERALVLLTRANGGDLVFSAILRTLDTIAAQKLALRVDPPVHDDQPERWFLHKIFDQHRHLCIAFANLPVQERKPMVLTVDSIEVGPKPIPLLEQVDNSRFLIPTSLLSPTSSLIESVTSSSILPILRVLGVQNTLRLLSAMLSECRVLLVSSSPTRLAQCARSALSIMAQGLLNWQHLYIPVLPPHLFQYLAAPVPYLVGMLTSMLPRLDQARSEGLGEMVIINLDTCQMETRGINPAEVSQKIPDLFQSAMAEQGAPATAMSAPETLAQDLGDLLKVDKRSLYGESTLTNVSETAAKATKAVKSGLLKLKEKGKKFLSSRSSSSASIESDDDGEGVGGTTGEGEAPDGHALSPDVIYTQGAQNEVTEEEARIAFASFFLSMFGNMRWYLSASPGQLPRLDRQRFLQQKRAMGEGENTPIWPLLQNFCQTQMLEEFAKARVEEVRTRLPVTSDSPLFAQCADYHRLHNIDFSVMSVRRVARQVAQNSPSRLVLQTQARRTTMLLTSNKTFEGDYNKAVAQLVEQCRECSSVLLDVMSVIWVRLRDSKGLHWKHGFQSLQILRNLLYHGPLSAIAEATDGLDKIRVMKFYNDNMRSQICTQIRQAASQVFNLLVDRSKLYTIRRLCINKRRIMRKPDQGHFVRDSRMKATTPFGAMHNAYNPKSARVAPLPGERPPPPQFAAEQDLLGFANPEPAPAPVVGQPDPFSPAAPASSQTPQAPSSTENVQDVVGLFTDMSVSGTAPAPAPADPFSSSGATQTPAPTDPFASSAQPATTVPVNAPAPPTAGSFAPPVPQPYGQQQQFQHTGQTPAPSQVPQVQAAPQAVSHQYGAQQQTQPNVPPQQAPGQAYQQNMVSTQGQPGQPYQTQGYPSAPNQGHPQQQQHSQYPAGGHYYQQSSAQQPYHQQAPQQPGYQQAPPPQQQQQYQGQTYPAAQVPPGTGQQVPGAQFDPFK